MSCLLHALISGTSLRLHLVQQKSKSSRVTPEALHLQWLEHLPWIHRLQPTTHADNNHLAFPTFQSSLTRTPQKRPRKARDETHPAPYNIIHKPLFNKLYKEVREDMK